MSYCPHHHTCSFDVGADDFAPLMEYRWRQATCPVCVSPVDSAQQINTTDDYKDIREHRVQAMKGLVL